MLRFAAHVNKERGNFELARAARAEWRQFCMHTARMQHSSLCLQTTTREGRKEGSVFCYCLPVVEFPRKETEEEEGCSHH